MIQEHEEVKIFEGDITGFHPALDFKLGQAYVTVPLPTQTPNGVQVKLWVISSEKETYILSEEELAERKLYAIVKDTFIQPRWSRESINAWRSSDVDFTLRAVFRDLRKRYKVYLDYADHRLYTLMPLWIIGTYFFPLFDGYPIIYLNGVSGSGKTKTGELAAAVSFNALLSTNISDAGFFRMVHLARATLILDENEKISDIKDGSSQMNLLLGSYKPGAEVLRIKKTKDGNFEPEGFQIYAPKMISNIRGLREPALLNRSIKLTLTPSQGPQAKREFNSRSRKILELRDQLYVYMMNHWGDIVKAKKELKNMDLGLSGYDRLNWLPILTLAKLLGDDVFQEMLKMAQEKSKENRMSCQDNDNLCKVYYIVRKVFSEKILAYDGEKKFLPFDNIYNRFVLDLGYKLGIDKIPPWYSRQTVGRMIEQLDIGTYDRVPDEGKVIRGRWVTKESLERVKERFGFTNP